MTENTPARPSEALALHRNSIIVALRGLGVVGAEILGSVTKGTDTAESDIDLVVRLRDPQPTGYAHAAVLDAIEQTLETIIGFRCDVLQEESPGIERVATNRLELFRD